MNRTTELTKQLIYVIPQTALTASLPYYESVNAGFPSPADDYIEEYLDLNEYLIYNKLATFFVKVSGDSMTGTGIYHGDVLIVDKSINAQSNDIIVAYIDGEFTVKRLIKTGTKAYLKPENPNYSPIPITPFSDFRVWGVVTNVIHKTKSV